MRLHSLVKLDANACTPYAARMATEKFTPHHQMAWTTLVRASERILQATEAALKAEGLPPLVWYDVLLELDRAQSDGLRPYELQEKMLLQQYNASRLISRLEKAGYVIREPCPSDGRGHVLKITARGATMKNKIWPVYRDVLEKEIGTRIGVQDAQTLVPLLEQLAADPAS